MQRAQADRARIAARTTITPARNRGTLGTDPGARASTPRAALRANIRNRKAVRLTATQRSSDTGKRSEWNASPYYRNAVTIDARWSA